MKTSRTVPPSRSLAALALAISLVLAGCGGGEPPAEGEAGEAETTAQAEKGKTDEKKVEAVPVEVAAVAKRPIAARFTGTANLEAPGEAQVVAKTSGVLLQLLAEEGDQVKAGQVLARIDPELGGLGVQTGPVSLERRPAASGKRRFRGRQLHLCEFQSLLLRFNIQRAVGPDRLEHDR